MDRHVRAYPDVPSDMTSLGWVSREALATILEYISETPKSLDRIAEEMECDGRGYSKTHLSNALKQLEHQDRIISYYSSKRARAGKGYRQPRRYYCLVPEGETPEQCRKRLSRSMTAYDRNTTVLRCVCLHLDSTRWTKRKCRQNHLSNV